MSLKSNYEYIRDWCNHKFLTKDEQISVDLSNYYTKSEVDSAITDATDDIDLSNYVTDSELATGLSTKQNTISDLSTIRSNAAAGAAKVSNVQSDWNATSGLARILNKPNLDNYLTIEDYTQDEEVVAAALNDLHSKKQATLVSGTNIKTVNGTSLLGSGDIAIPTKVSDLTNDSGFITGYTETDPVFTASVAHDITSQDITNWNNKLSTSPVSIYEVDVHSQGLSSSALAGIELEGINDFVSNANANSRIAVLRITFDGGLYGVYDFYCTTDRLEADGELYFIGSHSNGVVFLECIGETLSGLSGPFRVSSSGNGNAITNISFDVDSSVLTVTKGATFALASELPTKTSDLTNDSGFITNAGVTSFNGSTGAVTYTAPVTSVNGSTGAVTIAVPTATSDLTNDSGFQSLAYTAISSASSTTALVWKTMYQWTVNPTSITLTLPSAPSDPRGEIVLKFTTGSTAPTITWPSTLKWANGEELTVEASTTYEFSIGYDMMGGWTIIGCGFSAVS